MPIPIVGKPRDVVGLSDVQMAAFAAVANHLAGLGIGLHCAKCEADLQGANAEIDQTFSVTCQCREFKADNPAVRMSPDFYQPGLPFA